jgi:hypothetical protein
MLVIVVITVRENKFNTNMKQEAKLQFYIRILYITLQLMCKKHIWETPTRHTHLNLHVC